MIISIDILLYRTESNHRIFEVSANIVSLGMRIDIVSNHPIYTPTNQHCGVNFAIKGPVLLLLLFSSTQEIIE